MVLALAIIADTICYLSHSVNPLQPEITKVCVGVFSAQYDENS